MAGGKSSRMGQDKALLSFRGAKMIDHIAEVLRTGDIEQIFVSGNYEGYDCIKDTYKNAGPVGGICTIVAALYGKFDRAIIVPVDMPHISQTIVTALLHHDSKLDAIHFENEPMPLFLNLNTKVKTRCVEIELQISHDKSLSVRELIGGLECLVLPITPETSRQLINTNSPQDWAKATADE